MTQGRYRSMTLTSVRACAGRGAVMGAVDKLETLASIETRSTFAGMAAARCATSADNSKNGRAWRGRPEKVRRADLWGNSHTDEADGPLRSSESPALNCSVFGLPRYLRPSLPDVKTAAVGLPGAAA